MAKRVAIIGGGIAGATTALVLGARGYSVTLFEKRDTLISGPPFCHLHAGGNLYREISNQQCITLLKQSIDFVKFYPFAIDKRPTVITLPIYDKQDPLELIPRLELLKKSYFELIQEDSTNKVLGEASNYFEIFSKEQLLELSKEDIIQNPKSNKEWLIAFAKQIDFNSIKFPIIVVQEYGINLFMVAAAATLALKKMPNVTLKLNCEVTNLEDNGSTFRVGYKEEVAEFDYLINAAGFKSAQVDSLLAISEPRMVEFKAAFIAHWQQHKGSLPEVIFHGKRGTPKGMGQFTPYCGNYVQLHAMTQDITLCKECLAKSNNSSYPKLNQKLIDRVEHGWKKEEYIARTKRAIEYLSQFFPNFKEAQVGAKPLFGVQQIPGSDPTLRVAQVAFPLKNYARCEIVKVSSVVDMVRAIVSNIENNLSIAKDQIFQIEQLQELNSSEVKSSAKKIAKVLHYPTLMANPCRDL